MIKKTDAQLFKELRINVMILAVMMILIFILTRFIFKDVLEVVWYQFMLLLFGLLLLSYTFSKYFQDNPKIRNIIMWMLLALAIIGVVLLFLVS